MLSGKMRVLFLYLKPKKSIQPKNVIDTLSYLADFMYTMTSMLMLSLHLCICIFFLFLCILFYVYFLNSERIKQGSDIPSLIYRMGYIKYLIFFSSTYWMQQKKTPALETAFFLVKISDPDRRLLANLYALMFVDHWCAYLRGLIRFSVGNFYEGIRLFQFITSDWFFLLHTYMVDRLLSTIWCSAWVRYRLGTPSTLCKEKRSSIA